jgi:hypothetical protein
LRLFLHFLRVGIIQDKALAALAIEDKKMQYAAADRSILKMYCKQHFEI